MGATHQKSFQVNVDDEDDDGEDHGDDGDEDGDESDVDGNVDEDDSYSCNKSIEFCRLSSDSRFTSSS